MSHWNNRVFKQFQEYPQSILDEYGDEEKGEWTYSIRETYYNEDGEVTMFSNEPRPAFGDDLEGLKETLERMLSACDKEVLDVNMKLASNDFDDEVAELDNFDDTLDDNLESEDLPPLGDNDSWCGPVSEMDSEGIFKAITDIPEGVINMDGKDNVSYDMHFDVPEKEFFDIAEKHEHHVRFGMGEKCVNAYYDTDAYKSILQKIITKQLRDLGVDFKIEINHIVTGEFEQ